MEPPVERKRPGKTLVRVGFGVFIIICLTGVSGLAYLASSPLPEGSEPAPVVVVPGASTGQVADLLASAGVIRSPLLFRVVARLMKADGRIQSGEYVFQPGINVRDALDILVKGKVVYHPFTVREGLALEDIAALVEEKSFGSKDKFLEAASDLSLAPDFVPHDYLKSAKYPLEGYLFPDTYYIRKGMTERDLVVMMTQRFLEVFTEELQEKAASMGLSPHEAATLSAIVEREAQAPDERPIIAAVYLNRLKIGMKLDADPTVLYALGKPPDALVLWKDLEVDSPYNTYRNPGLPPGPIGNFGKASLEAVLNPEDVDFLYFVAKNDGTHAFARTLSEHNANRALYQGH